MSGRAFPKLKAEGYVVFYDVKAGAAVGSVRDLSSGGNGYALAQLFAASPDLLDALQTVMEALESYRTGSDYFPDFPSWEDAARAAIAKATMKPSSLPQNEECGSNVR